VIRLLAACLAGFCVGYAVAQRRTDHGDTSRWYADYLRDHPEDE
jgi:hypothetical protein